MAEKIYVIDRKWRDDKNNIHKSSVDFKRNEDGFKIAKSVYQYYAGLYSTTTVEISKAIKTADGRIERRQMMRKMKDSRYDWDGATMLA